MSKRNLWWARPSSRAARALGVAQSVLEEAADAQAKAARAGAAVRSRPDVAQAAAQSLAARQRDRRRRRHAGSRLHHPSRRRRRSIRKEIYAAAESADVANAASPRRRFSSSIRTAICVQGVGRPGPGLRVARLEPRHHARLQGQRLDRRQRRQRRPHPEVHAGRQVPQAVRLRRTRTPAATTRGRSTRSRRSRSTRRRTRPTSPTATATSASR